MSQSLNCGHAGGTDLKGLVEQINFLTASKLGTCWVGLSFAELINYNVVKKEKAIKWWMYKYKGKSGSEQTHTHPNLHLHTSKYTYTHTYMHPQHRLFPSNNFIGKIIIKGIRAEGLSLKTLGYKEGFLTTQS